MSFKKALANVMKKGGKGKPMPPKGAPAAKGAEAKKGKC